MGNFLSNIYNLAWGKDRLAPTATASRPKPAPKASIPPVPKAAIAEPIIKPAVLSWSRKQPKFARLRDGTFEEHAYDLNEILRAEDTEMYIAKAFQEYNQLVLREGFAVKGQDQKLVDYLNRRLYEIQVLTNQSISWTMRRIAQDLIKFSNAYVVFTRQNPNKRIGSGQPYRYNGRRLQPITGIFVADPTTMFVKRGEHGQILAYRQYIPNTGNEKIYPPSQVVHFTYNQKSGMGYGTPWIMSTLDDVRMLRRLEEYVDMLCGLYALPLYQYKIGSDKLPATIDPKSGLAEVDIAKLEIEGLPTEGCLVTDHRHEIEVVGAKGSALDISKYIEHFKARVIAGVGMSGVALGEGGTANRGTASQMLQVATNRCKDIQEVIADTFTTKILFQLVLDSEAPVSFDTMPFLDFAEVDLEEKRARENHAADLFNNALVTSSEAREIMNRNQLSDEEREDDIIGTNKRRENEQQLKMQLAIIAATPKPTTSTSTSKPKSSSSKTQSGKTKTANKSRPTNQSGTKATKAKVRKNDAVKHIREEIGLLRHQIARTGSDALDEGWVKKTVDFYLDKLHSIVDNFIQKEAHSRCDQLALPRIDTETVAEITESMKSTYLNGSVTTCVDKIISAKPYTDKESIIGVVNSVEGLFTNAVERMNNDLDESFELQLETQLNA